MSDVEREQVSLHVSRYWYNGNGPWLFEVTSDDLSELERALIAGLMDAGRGGGPEAVREAVDRWYPCFPGSGCFLFVGGSPTSYPCSRNIFLIFSIVNGAEPS